MILKTTKRFAKAAAFTLTVATMLIGGHALKAQTLTPEVTAWYLNTTNYTGYNNIVADCQRVAYSTNYVYPHCSGVPEYTIGPWAGNPNTPSNQSYVFKITRNPVENTGTKTATALGNIAVLVNGVTIFNALDAMSYNNQGIWHQDANYFEASSFDASGGHPAPGGRYHYHRRPLPLCANDSSAHSAIIGYSFDGFPIYGPFGYSDPNNASSAITRIKSSYRLRSITTRTSLPDGTVLQPSQYGPAVGTQYPLGAYIEDYEYVSGQGHLDEYNGRFCKTPEYPNGIYAYFATTDNSHNATYPYFIGPSYYGVLVTENVGPTGGHVTISEPTTDWTGAVAITDPVGDEGLQIFPNPAHDRISVRSTVAGTIQVLTPLGQVVLETEVVAAEPLVLSTADLMAGLYFVRVQSGTIATTKRLVIQ